MVLLYVYLLGLIINGASIAKQKYTMFYVKKQLRFVVYLISKRTLENRCVDKCNGNNNIVTIDDKSEQIETNVM